MSDITFEAYRSARLAEGVGDETRHLRAGDSFKLERGVPHAERYGAAGATFWTARRHDG